MKEARVEKIVDELKSTVIRLNRLTAILNATNTSYYLHQKTKNGEWMLEDIRQEVNYE